MRGTWTIALALAGTQLLAAAPRPAVPMPPPLPPVREQDRDPPGVARRRGSSAVLPGLMRKHGVAMWLVVCREYNEDPALLLAGRRPR